MTKVATSEKPVPGAAGSRFAGTGRWHARLILGLFLLLIVNGLAQSPAPVPTVQGTSEDKADVSLFEDLIEGVRAGGNYHEVAVTAQREQGFPLRPFVAVRLPTLAWLHAALPRGGAAILFYLLVAAMLAAWARRLGAEGLPARRTTIGALLLMSGSATLLLPDLIVYHEAWAALLIALSLALHGERRYAPAVAAGLAAALIREQAILYPLIVALVSLHSRRWREAGLWGAAVAAFAGFILWHSMEVSALLRPGDPTSPGWAGAGGWGSAVTMVQLTGPFRLLPYWLAALALPLALIGWAGWRSAVAVRAALFIAAILLLLAAFARPDNFYWGFLIAPLVPLGLLFAPRALADLAAAAAGRLPRPALST